MECGTSLASRKRWGMLVKPKIPSLGRKLKVGILGGAFDPIHVGHIDTARVVLTEGIVDEVWLTPCYKHVHGKRMVLSNHRLYMCKLASEIDNRIKIFDYEIQKELSGETYYFVNQLLQEYYAKNQCDFRLIIGLDNALTFDKWPNHSYLEQSIGFIVVRRAGVTMSDIEDRWFFKSPHIYVSKAPTQMSSTFIRQKLQEGEIKLSYALDKAVLKYITDEGLYK